MHGQEEQMFLFSQLPQCDAQQRPLSQVKRLLGFLRGQSLDLNLPLGPTEFPEIHYPQLYGYVGGDDLDWLPLHSWKRGSEDFVALHYLPYALP
jgi:hypothetical protein